MTGAPPTGASAAGGPGSSSADGPCISAGRSSGASLAGAGRVVRRGGHRSRRGAGQGTCPPVGRYGAARHSGLDRQPRALGTNAAFSAGAVVPGAAEAPDRWASSQDDGQAGRRAAGNRGAGAHQAAPRDVVGGVADGRGPGTSGWHFTICSPENCFHDSPEVFRVRGTFVAHPLCPTTQLWDIRTSTKAGQGADFPSEN